MHQTVPHIPLDDLEWVI